MNYEDTVCVDAIASVLLPPPLSRTPLIHANMMLDLMKDNGSTFKNASQKPRFKGSLERPLTETILANADGEKTRKLIGRGLL